MGKKKKKKLKNEGSSIYKEGGVKVEESDLDRFEASYISPV